jgi:hypothetical protein
MRWENVCDNSDDEEERLHQYKLNRRKRYLAAANQKYSEWVKTLNGSNHSLSSNGDGVNNETSAKSSSSATSNGPTVSTGYVKAINSAVVDSFVPGLVGGINVHRTSGQMVLQC